MKEPVFTGSATAIVTPFCGDDVDFDAFARLIDFQLAGDTDAIVVCGTTGEAATLSPHERSRVIEYCIRRVDGRVPVIAGAGSNSTSAAASLSRDTQSMGADALLIVTPYYNKATQEGLVRHFSLVADSVTIPVIVYNVPSRTGISCTAETYAALSLHPNINGIKEASGNYSLVQDTINRCADDLTVWSGNDEDTVCLCALGAKGVISVASNIIPAEMHRLTQLCLSNDILAAGQQQLRLADLIRALFCAVNPIPVKEALAEMGLCQSALRLPLCAMQPQQREHLHTILRQYDLIA